MTIRVARDGAHAAPLGRFDVRRPDGPPAWPHVCATHVHARTPDGALAVTIALALDGAATPDDALPRYREIAARAASARMRLVGPLLEEDGVPLDDGQTDVVRAFAAECARHLEAVDGARRSAVPPGPAPTAALRVPLSPSALRAAALLPIELSLAVAPWEGDAPVEAFRIAPRPDADGTGRHAAFARAFEDAWRTPTWSLRVAADLNAARLWAVRLAERGAAGLHLAIDGDGICFAPPPIARGFTARSVTVTDHRTGATTSIFFAGVDPNRWFQLALDAADRVLPAPRALPLARRLLRPSVEPPSARSALCERVRASIDGLARSIAASLLPILPNAAADARARAVASEAFRQALVVRLGHTHATCVAAVCAVEPSACLTDAEAHPASLVGRVAVARHADAGTSRAEGPPAAARIPLDAAGTPRFAFVASPGARDGERLVPMDATFAGAFLVADAPPEDAAGGTHARWLSLVTGPLTVAIAPPPTRVPRVEHALPVPPMMLGHSATEHTAASDGPSAPADLATWDYRLSYRNENPAWEPVRVAIALDATPGEHAGPAECDATLFDALARLVSAWPSIRADLDTADGACSLAALAAFADRLDAVARAHGTTTLATPPSDTSPAPSPRAPRLAFTHVLAADAAGAARVDLYDATIDDRAATYDAATRRFACGATSLPAPVVEIDPDRFYAEVAEAPAPGLAVSYRYRRRTADDAATREPLSYAAAAAIATRSVALGGLNVFAHPCANAFVRVERNASLVPFAGDAIVRTEPAFVLSGRPSTFASPVLPFLDHELLEIQPAPSTPAADFGARLGDRLAALVQRAPAGAAASLTMAVAWAWAPAIDDDRVTAQLPICLVEPTVTPLTATAMHDLARRLADHVDAWRRETRPPTRNACVEIDLCFNRDAPGAPPALRIRRLSLAWP